MSFGRLVKRALLGALFLFPNLAQAGFYEEHVEPTWQRSTDSTSGWIFSAGLLSTLLARSQDDQHRNLWSDHQLMSEKDASYGDFLGTGIPGLLIGLGQTYWFDHDNGVAHLRGFFYSGIATYSLKFAFGRKRPGDSQNYQSFPSGHTSTTFASATALTYAYGWKAGVVAYPLAVFTAASRWADDAHWLSDTVAGAFLGVLCARAAFYLPASEPSTSHYLPVWSSEFQGILWVNHF